MTIEDERKGYPSASGLERIALCPGSQNLEAMFPESDSNEYAKSGNRIHEALAGFIGAADLLNDDERWVADRCRVLENTVLENVGMRTKDLSEREERLWSIGNDDQRFSGKPDVVYQRGRNVLVIDYKTGRAKVAGAETNWQMRALAVLAYDNYVSVENVFVAVIQPRIKESLTICRYTVADIDQARYEIIKILSDAARIDAPRNPGLKQCRYCRAKATCPELRRVGFTINVTCPPTMITRPNEVTTEQLAVLLAEAELATMLANAVRDVAKERLRNGECIEGWSLEPGKKRRIITDPQLAYDRLSGLATPDEFTAAWSKGINGIDQLVKTKTGLQGKPLKDRVAALLGDALQFKSDDYSLSKVAE